MSSGSTKRNLGTAAGLLGLIGILFLKFKVYFLGIFKAVPLLKLGWLMKSGSSMFLSLALYMSLYGWKYALTIVGLIYVHEMGHYIFMHMKGLKPQAPVFVPFLGAYVAMTHLPKDMATHAWVAFAGPYVGGLGAAVLYYLGQHMDNPALVAGASTGFILNLLQLIPVKPFDGGFIAAAISRWLFIPGTIVVVIAALYMKSILLTIIAVVSVFMLFSMFRSRGEAVELTPPAPDQRILIALAYFGLAGALGWLYWSSEELLIYIHGQGALR